GYDGVHLVGRLLSGLVDLIAILFTFLIGRRLYDSRVGLIASFLMTTAVMPIQQSHFYTMDNWASALTTIAIYIAILAADDGLNIRWWALFGLFLGLTVASRINVAPLALIAGVAGLIWLGKQFFADVDVNKEAVSERAFVNYVTSSRGQQHLYAIVIGGMTAALVSLFVFRVAMPYAFSDAAMIRNEALLETGEEPSFLRLAVQSIVGINPQWWANMEEIQRLQAPEANFPPALQWTDRPAIIFPWINMVLYGMGPLAGLLAWIGVIVATWQMVTRRQAWLIHAIPVIWIWLYFLFSATRWVKSIRYFLPIYPVLFVMAGWLIIWLYDRWRSNRAESTRKSPSAAQYIALGIGGLTLVTSFLWANAFVGIYRRPMTRVEATQWMFENVPTGATLLDSTTPSGDQFQMPMWGANLSSGAPTFVNFSVDDPFELSALQFNYVTTPGDGQTGQINVSLRGPDGSNSLTNGAASFSQLTREPLLIELAPITLNPGENYTLEISTDLSGNVEMGTSILTSEHWDDALPVRYDGKDPFSQYFRGVSTGQMTTTHPDSDQKANELYNWLQEADYVVISSQRSLWSLPRLPLTYPLMIRYYEALFSGDLGFELVAEFHGDIRVGPLYISDTTGQVGWGDLPEIGWPPPGSLAAEEAFSVYDHPPVWIFKKTDQYDPAAVGQIFSDVDLTNVIVQNPLEATNSPNGLRFTGEQLAAQIEGGTFREVFNIDGLLSNNGAAAVVVWWLMVILLGWIGFPLAYIVFSGLADRGYVFSRIIILLLLSWSSWFVASYGWLPNTAGTLLIMLLLVAAISGFILYRRRTEINHFVVENWRFLLLLEGIGLGLFLLQLSIRLGNPDVWDVIWGGEKPMDTSYFTAVLKSTVYPPYDPWQSGAYINYYYFGFVYTGVLTKLLRIVPTVAYNLILPTLFSFTGLGVFVLTYTLGIKAFDRSSDQSEGRQPFHWRSLAAIGGYFAILLAMVLGNLKQLGVMFNAWVRTSTLPADQSIVSRFFEGGYQVLTGTQPAIYPGDWFWTATRAISINEGEVQPITEFPFFTFLYGDLHAHMIALPLTIAALAWAMSLVITGGKQLTWLHWLVGGLAIGVLYPTNSWDYPTYMVIGLLALVYINIKGYGLSLQALGRLILQGSTLYLISRYAFQPFWANFGTAYGTIRLWEGSYTPVFDFLGIYGLFLFVILTWLFIDLKSWMTALPTQSLNENAGYTSAGVSAGVLLVPVMAFGIYSGYETLPITLAIIIFAGLLGLRSNISPERRIVNILVSSAFGLILFVEIFVLDGDIGRMNTVFKFYMQVWIFLSIAAGVSLVWALPRIIKRWGDMNRTAWLTALALLIFVATLYPVLATRAKFAIRNVDEDMPLTLDGAEFLSYTSYGDSGRTITLADDREAILWMQANIDGSPVTAEAHSSNPYRTVGNRISMYTGNPSIIGWDWHQRQQRPTLPGNTVSNRINDVTALYRSQDLSLTLDLIDKYDIQYIYFGQLEDTYYGFEALEKFEEMVEFGILDEVYQNDTVKIFQVTS
ncbi:MAG: DUF2298 domain-containing protein, partial [Chloroflexota bacterium]